jgi:hypothetical protein
MNNDHPKQENEQNHDNEHEVLKTFDMYHFFSRKDVLLAIGFIVILLLALLIKTLFMPQIV